MYLGLQVVYLLSFEIVNETWIFSTDFSKNTQILNLMKIGSMGAMLFCAEERTDRRDEANSCFSQ